MPASLAATLHKQTAGEDPFLTAAFAQNIVKGLQGDSHSITKVGDKAVGIVVKMCFLRGSGGKIGGVAA